MNADSLSPRSLAKREQILKGASHLFLTQGYADTSMDGIASEAGVSKQTLYSYFRSKEDLLTAVLQRRIQQTLADTWSAHEEQATPNDTEDLALRLRTISRQLVNGLMHPDYLALVRVIIAESPRMPALGQLFRETVPARVLGSVDTILRQAHDAGLVRVECADAATRMLVGSLLTYVLLDGLLVTDRAPEPPDDASVDRIVDLFLRAITNADDRIS